MITKNLLVLNKKALQISILYTITLLIVSLITLDFDSLETVVPSFSDKIFHFAAYSVLALLWFNTFSIKFKYSKKKALVIAAILCIAFGIIVEVLQKEITNTRFFDVYDIIANILGVVLTVLILIFNTKTDVKKY